MVNIRLVYQEFLLIGKYKASLPGVSTFFAIGATLDFEAGNLRRAPAWMSSAGLEWLYRLILEPGRLWKRYLVEDVGFFALILRQKLNLNRKKTFLTGKTYLNQDN